MKSYSNVTSIMKTSLKMLPLQPGGSIIKTKGREYASIALQPVGSMIKTEGRQHASFVITSGAVSGEGRGVTVALTNNTDSDQCTNT